MKYTTFVALMLLSLQCFAGKPSSAFQSIENQWADIYYNLPKEKQETAFSSLQTKIQSLAVPSTDKAEQLFWEAVIIATKAELQDGLTALESVKKAKDLLTEAITINPTVANGSAHVTLGTLYYMVPQWPISFGDHEKAKQMLITALKINPNAIDANYFYGDFLLSDNKTQEARKYFEKALSIPPRNEQSYADNKLKEEAKLALANAKDRKLNGIKSAFLSLFTSASLAE